ncbi:MAG: DNA methyltransferase [Bacillota bacterium]
MSFAMLLRACPYYTMFPLDFPIQHLQKAHPGQWVLDPFCGRGTTLYAARLLGLPASGVDVSPVAAAIADAMLACSSSEAVVEACISLLRRAGQPCDVPEGEFWELAYHRSTLRDLCSLREAFLANGELDPSHRLLRLILLGRLHGPLRRRYPTYFSNQMPRTYAPKPAYAVRYWRQRGLVAPEVDVIEVVRRKAPDYINPDLPPVDGAVALGDSRTYDFMKLGGPYSWVVTSPPYYGMKTYVPDQWLRRWFLGGSAAVPYEYDGQVGSNGLASFTSALRDVWKNVAMACVPGATLVIRFGALPSCEVDPVWLCLETLRDTPWKVIGIAPAGNPERGRRQARQFGRKVGNPAKEVDVIACMP